MRETNIQERLKQRIFVVASSALLADPRWVNVSDIFKGDRTDAQILKPLVTSFDDPLFDKYSKRLQAVRKIRDYPYVMHVLDKSLSYEEVAEIFVRVNSLGIKLRGSDLALAQITSRWQDSLKLFETFQEECEEASWFGLDLGVIVRALVVFATGQSRFKTVGTIPVSDLKAGWEDAKEGLRFALNFLRTNAGIENETLLPSPMFVIALAYFGAKRSFALSPTDEAGIKKWVYVASVRGHYSGSSETTLDADLNIVSKNEDLMAALQLQLGRLHVEPADLIGRGQRSALFAMSYLALKARGAKDWNSQLGLSLTHQGKFHFIQYHHLFPKALLSKAGYDKAAINEIANMAFISGKTNRKLARRLPTFTLPRYSRSRGRKLLSLTASPQIPPCGRLKPIQSSWNTDGPPWPRRSTTSSPLKPTAHNRQT